MNAVPWEHGLGFTSMPSALVLAQSVKNGNRHSKHQNSNRIDIKHTARSGIPSRMISYFLFHVQLFAFTQCCSRGARQSVRLQPMRSADDELSVFQRQFASSP